MKRKLTLVSFFWLLLGCFRSEAESIIPNCLNNSMSCDQKSTLCTIIRPYQKDSGESVCLDYTFKYRAPKENAPTLMFIPGGPGDLSMDEDFENFSKLNGLPENFGVILTDPQFIGGNKKKESSLYQDFITSQNIAQDLLAIMESLINAKKSKGGFILYGVSYGTVLATIVASASAENDHIKSVLLVGTVGKSFIEEEFVNTFQKEYKDLKEDFIKQNGFPIYLRFLENLKRIVDKNIYTQEDLGILFQSLLAARKNVNGILNLHDFMKLIALNLQDAIPNIQKIVNFVKKHKEDQDYNLFHNSIVCRELNPSELKNDLIFDLLQKKLKKDTQSLSPCSDILNKYSTNLYDSKKYSVQAPILYIVGEKDPATPQSFTFYHYDEQKNRDNKVVIVVPDEGHIMKNCKDLSFWENLARGDLTEAKNNYLKKCGIEVNSSKF